MKTSLFLLSLLLFSCKGSGPQDHAAAAIAAIAAAEKAFADKAIAEGVPAAFLAFAAEDAVLLRGERLIEGKAAIAEYFNNSTLREVRLEWTPDFIDAAASGDLGYTYGRYTFSALDSTGAPLNARGYFHTVWKKQADGTWKFVWD